MNPGASPGDSNRCAKRRSCSNEREVFIKTEEYRKICQLVDAAQQHFGLVTGATPKRSSRMVLNVPLSLQRALEREAHAEGLSVEQLVVAKLAAQLSGMVSK